jgi:3-hydroxyacyl-CoA dehydrogenase
MIPPDAVANGQKCIPEKLKLKQTLLSELDQKLAGDIIIASNSSSYTINEIIRDAKLKHPDRTVSMHSC